MESGGFLPRFPQVPLRKHWSARFSLFLKIFPKGLLR
jgi:hypothetical protein